MAITVFTNAFLIDCTGKDPAEGAAVVVEGERIKDVIASGKVGPLPGKVDTVDLKGRTLMPGLTDAHVHVCAVEGNIPEQHRHNPPSLIAAKALRRMEQCLMQGFTTVRDAGGADYGFREAAESGLYPGPRMLVSGRPLSQTGGHADKRRRSEWIEPVNCCVGMAGMIADGADEVRKAARENLRHDVDQIKIMASGGAMSPGDELDTTQYTVDEMRAAVEEARAVGKYVLAHAYSGSAIRNAIQAGVRCIEHGNLLDEAGAQAIKAAGAYLVPTMVTYEAISREGKNYGIGDHQIQKINLALEKSLEGLAHAYRAGCKIGSGSDLLGDMQSQRAMEFELKGQVMKPMEVLLSATMVNAEIFRMTDRIGSVEPGKYADLLVVDGDPLKNLRVFQNTAHIHAIVKGGVFVKRARSSTMPNAADFEKLGVFYLGRSYDWQQKKAQDGLILYDSKDLVTHAVCVGMTGSGKTGLCLALIEEAAIDGIPAILIDPKGDLANLLLTFPGLKPEDFRPWVNEDDARRKNLSVDDYARQQAELWQKGLASWGEDGARIQRLRDAADFAVYTPGSNAGIPLSILKSFAAPPPAIREDEELLRERIGTTATSLLGLLGIDADPIKSREHILIATILDTAWREGQELDLAGLIQQIQTPPVKRVGVLDLDAFFPSKDRFALAMALNNLLAAPGFGAWMEGEPLDVGSLLHTPSGKPRVAIVSIAHLNDAERMFFVSLLLNQVVGWMRTQSGTTSLRALLYMDEIFGFFPPVANPPSKTPLLTLLKQARAFGVGVVLATQNPVDLDYKGLSNTGTWFIGRLQTERDKARVLDGLEGAAGSAGQGFDRAGLERILSGLSSRVFLMNNVHEDHPVVFESRWVMSYLRGPLTRAQIKTLMDARRGAPAPAAARTPVEAPASTATATGQPPAAKASRAAAPVAAGAGQRPLLPPDVPQHFVPARGGAPVGSILLYQPMLVGSAQVRVSDTRNQIDVSRDVTVLAPITGEAVPVAWNQAAVVGFTPAELTPVPEGDAAFADLPVPAGMKKSYDGWTKEFAGWLLQSQKIELLRCPSLKAVSKPDESERDFRVRLQESTRQDRDRASETLRQKYAPKQAALQERRRRAEQAVARESEQARQQGLQTAISVGATILGAFLGRKSINVGTIGRATTAARGAGRVLKETQDVGRAKETVAAVDAEIAALDVQFKAEADALGARTDPLTEPIETIALKPTRQNISVRLVALAWAPAWRDAAGRVTPAWE